MNQEWLYADDLLTGGTWKEFTLTIKKAHPPNSIQDPKDPKGHKMIQDEALEFQGAKKLLGLNKGNRRVLALIAGSGMPEDWVGVKIKIHVVVGTFFGVKNCPAIRIRCPEGAVIPFAIQKARKDERDITGTSEGVAPRQVVEEAANGVKQVKHPEENNQNEADELSNI